MKSEGGSAARKARIMALASAYEAPPITSEREAKNQILALSVINKDNLPYETQRLHEAAKPYFDLKPQVDGIKFVPIGIDEEFAYIDKNPTDTSTLFSPTIPKAADGYRLIEPRANSREEPPNRR